MHAIYEPDEHEVFGDCYMAAVDLFHPGLTFKVFFALDEKGSFQVQHAERWYFG